MSWSKDMPWLPQAPAGLRSRLLSLLDCADDVGKQLKALATCQMSAGDASALARTISRVRANGSSLSPLSHFRLGILSNATFDLVQSWMPAAAARHGVALELIEAPYDQVMQQALNPLSVVNKSRPDAVLLAIDHHWLNLEQPVLDEAKSAQAIDDALNMLKHVVRSVREHSGAPSIIPTIPCPSHSLFGSFDRRLKGSVRNLIEAANRQITDLATKTGSYVFDVAAIAERIGTDTWFDHVQWNLYKLPFAASCMAVYADRLGLLLGAIRGHSKKCLVLDLDNTLWGGVVGDDGVEALKIGQGSAEGEAFLAVQRMALNLRDRGIILAVCSKNNDDTARKPFREHPDMLLKESDITVFQANWIEKASNLEAIAKQLNIGVDALVFLDDNPAERAHVRDALPMVAIPELPADPSMFPARLQAAGYFESISFSSEDVLRVASYAADAKRAEVMASARDAGDYLSSLDMVISFAPFDHLGRQRIAQLINKSNQFNLTTRRYTESECADFEKDETAFTLQARLSDRFSDLGMIGVVIARIIKYQDSTALDIDTWLMSCRVLGRKVEEAMLSKVMAFAAANECQWVLGQYIPTVKNVMVRDHYSKLGFELLGVSETDEKTFAMLTSKFQPNPLPMTIRDV